MIALDTNVLSEILRAEPAPRVRAWFDAQRPRDLFVPAIVLAEIADGIERMPQGARRASLGEQARALLWGAFAERVLPFDAAAAVAYGEVLALRRAAGRPMAMADALIAACARVRGLALATRNVRDFDRLGLRLVDPWRA